MKTALTFTLLTYGLGYFYLILPGFYLEYKGITNIRNDLCLGDKRIKDELTRFTLIAIGTITVLYLLFFKLLQLK